MYLQTSSLRNTDSFLDPTPVLPRLNEVESRVQSIRRKQSRGAAVNRQSFLQSITSDRDDYDLQDTPITPENIQDQKLDFDFNLPRRSASTVRSKSVPPKKRPDWSVTHSPPLLRPRSQGAAADIEGHVLSIRGSLYSPLDGEVDWKSRIRSESAKRRIRRIVWTNKNLEDIQRREAARRKFKAAAFTVMMSQKIRIPSAPAITQTLSVLSLRRQISKSSGWKTKKAVLIFQWAIRVVRMSCRIMQFMGKYSAELETKTAAQEAWHALRHTKEAKEIIFHKEAYVRGKNSFAYVPSWARVIMDKHPEERTDSEVRQLHNMCRGLKAFDKFTHSIQLAMCRAFTYLKVEYPRQVLRKGHIGLSFYFVFSGSLFVNIEVQDPKTGQLFTRTNVILERGDSFGELALLRQIHRTASISTQHDTELLVVDKHFFVDVCPKLFDRELNEKVEFCRKLPLFGHWPEELVRDVCVEAQIIRYKSNQVIVEDSKKESDWIFACIEGKCSVLRVLDIDMFRLHPPTPRLNSDQTTRSEQLIKTEMNRPDTAKNAPRIRARNRGAPKSHGLLKELEKNLRSDKYFNILADNKDEHKGDETSDEEYSGDEQTEAEKEQAKKNEERASKKTEFISLAVHLRKMKDEGLEFLDIASIGPDNVFDMVGLVLPGRRLVLVSQGSKMIKIKKKLFFRISNKFSLERIRHIAPRYDYPSDQVLYHSYSEKYGWKQFKDNVVEGVLTQLRDKCVRHKPKPEDKTPLNAVKFVK